MKNSNKKSGFTLVEIMLATVISVMVFAAMGALLTRSFTLWMDAMANWKLAQHARVARTRLLDGAFGSGSGILSSCISNMTTNAASGESYIQYYPLGAGGAFRAYGWATAAAGKNLRMRSAASAWLLGQNVADINYTSDVSVALFQPSVPTNKIVVINYQLQLNLMGKTFTKPCTVTAYLNND